MPRSYTLQEIQKIAGGKLLGNSKESVTGVNGLETAKNGELTFAEHGRYLKLVRQSKASAIIVPEDFPSIKGKNLIHVSDPRIAFVKVIGLFQKDIPLVNGVHRSAVVSPEVSLGENISILEHAVVRQGTQIGKGSVIEACAFVGANVTIGQDCIIGPNVVIMGGTKLGNRVVIHGGSVIGGDGFGYVWLDGRHKKIPQTGNVIIEDDVEIGCNVCVDCATFGSTIIRKGTKVDNLVQIAHNDVIGKDVTISGQVGFAGSVTVGDRAVLGGQAGVADHIKIGDDAKVGAGSGVIKDVQSGETVWWFPARPIQHVKRELASLGMLPEMTREHRALEKRVVLLEARLKQSQGVKAKLAKPKSRISTRKSSRLRQKRK